MTLRALVEALRPIPHDRRNEVRDFLREATRLAPPAIERPIPVTYRQVRDQAERVRMQTLQQMIRPVYGPYSGKLAVAAHYLAVDAFLRAKRGPRIDRAVAAGVYVELRRRIFAKSGPVGLDTVKELIREAKEAGR